MIERIGRPLTFTAFFTSLKQGKTGLSVTVDVFDPTGTMVVTAASAAEIGDGLYSYVMSGTLSTVAGNYAAVFKTSDGTVDFQWVPALWTVGETWVQNLRYVEAAAAGNSSGTGTTTESYEDVSGALGFTVTFDVFNNRTVTYH